MVRLKDPARTDSQSFKGGDNYTTRLAVFSRDETRELLFLVRTCMYIIQLCTMKRQFQSINHCKQSNT